MPFHFNHLTYFIKHTCTVEKQLQQVLKNLGKWSSYPAVIQPVKTTVNQVLANGFQDCWLIAARKLSWPVFAFSSQNTQSYLLKED